MNLFVAFVSTFVIMLNFIFSVDGSIYAQNKCFGAYDPIGTHCRAMTRFDQFESRTPGFRIGEQLWRVQKWLDEPVGEK